FRPLVRTLSYFGLGLTVRGSRPVGVRAPTQRSRHFARRSSSAWAKYAAAFFRISLARAAQSSRARAASSAVAPRSSVRTACPDPARPVGPSYEASRRHIRSSRRSSNRRPLLLVLILVLQDHPHY